MFDGALEILGDFYTPLGEGAQRESGMNTQVQPPHDRLSNFILGPPPTFLGRGGIRACVR